MRKIIVLLLVCVSGYSQNAILMSEDWNLTKMVIEGVDLFPPVNGEFSSVPLTVSDDGNDFILTTNVCNYGTGTIEFIGEDQFHFDFFVLTLILCSNAENSAYETTYLGYFYEQHSNQNFTYAITDNGELKTLTITNSEGWQALYSNEELSARNPLTPNVLNISPNPAKDRITIGMPEIGFTGQVKIYNSQGQTVLNRAYIHSGQAIELPNLPAGIYFLNLINADVRHYSTFLVK